MTTQTDVAEEAAVVVAEPARGWRRYPAYRESGVAWLPSVPCAWDVVPLKHLTTHVTRGDGPDYVDDSSIKVINQACIQWSGMRLENVKYQREHDVSGWKSLLRPGDLLINSTGTGTLGRCVVFDEVSGTFIADSHVTIVRFAPGISEGYTYYLIQSLLYQGYIYAALVAGSTNQIELSREGLRAMPMIAPPLAEQHAIAAFLDRETARIDALAAKKERLIALLREKRAALISHAVTRGLDADAPMKESGVAWLGRVPAHWDVRRLAMAADKITNGYVGPTRDIFVDEGVRYLQSLHIKNGEIRFEKPYFVTDEWSSEHGKSILAEGDVLIVQTGDIGQCAAVTREFIGGNCHALIVVRLKAGLGSGFYLSAFLRSDYGYNMLRLSQTGALHPHLECGKVREIQILLPPADEQERIMCYLNRETAKLDTLISKVRQHIEKLREYRAALIAAAVTGKIDVRSAGAEPGWEGEGV